MLKMYPNYMNDIWNEYNHVRITGDKKKANKLLFDFIEYLKQQDKKDIHLFVDDICGQILDLDHELLSNNGTDVSDKEIRIQHPLFKEVILPILKEEYKKNNPKYIKWIGQFEQFFYSDRNSTEAFLRELNIDGFFEPRFFFEKSLALDKNQKTLTLLLYKIAQDLNYYTHEVPMAVLATPEVLSEEIATFRKFWEQSESKYDWEASLLEWELIAKHWSIYLETQVRYDNFENYLKENGIQFD